MPFASSTPRRRRCVRDSMHGITTVGGARDAWSRGLRPQRAADVARCPGSIDGVQMGQHSRMLYWCPSCQTHLDPRISRRSRRHAGDGSASGSAAIPGRSAVEPRSRLKVTGADIDRHPTPEGFSLGRGSGRRRSRRRLGRHDPSAPGIARRTRRCRAYPGRVGHQSHSTFEREPATAVDLAHRGTLAGRLHSSGVHRLL